MSKHAPRISSAGLAAALIVLVTTGTCTAAPAVSTTSVASVQDGPTAMELANAEGTESRDSQPCREYSGTRPESSYSDEYVFGLTRGIADSTMHPAAKILVFPMTVPLDLALLPFEVIGGLF